MKAISLHQPWATLIMLGAKKIETRSWAPPKSLIGERIAIHAGKRPVDPVVQMPTFQQFITDPERECPTGVLLGSVVLESAHEIEHKAEGPMIVREAGAEHDGAFGDYSLGRWAWLLIDVRVAPEPVPYLGGQRFFEVSRAAEKKLS